MSRRWKEIKEDPARLFTYNDKARQMRNETEKPTKSGDDLSVGSMVQHEETVTESFVVKRKQRQTQKVPKLPEFVETESDDSDNEEEEEQEPAVRQPQKAPKCSGPVRMKSDVSDHDKPMVKKNTDTA